MDELKSYRDLRRPKGRPDSPAREDLEAHAAPGLPAPACSGGGGACPSHGGGGLLGGLLGLGLLGNPCLLRGGRRL